MVGSHPGSPRSAGLDYSRLSSQQYGPNAADAPVPATASLLGDSAPGSHLSIPRPMSGYNSNRASHVSRASTAFTSGDGWGWNDPEADDYLHNPDPKRDGKNDRGGSVFTWRGVTNVGCLFMLLICLITLFAGYPIITHFTEDKQSNNGAYNMGGINSTGQVPYIPNFPQLIDPDTPSDVMSRTGFDGNNYELVFSDEFNKDGRTFYEGDDPFWQAVDFHYWPTGDLEWYDPSAITTEGGNLKITMSQEPLHDLQFQSGMLQSWNQMCFQYSYYMEVSVSLPGNNRIGGFWPGVWTMGNLGRPGYGATTDGTWPYTYDSCDVGTLVNQTNPDGKAPAAALNTGTDDGTLSYLPGQRVSACTCKGEDHPGPDVSYGRGVPEIDIIEAQVEISTSKGEMSQSLQVAPFDDFYQFDNSSAYVTIYDQDVTLLNSYLGGIYQQAVSALSYVPNGVYQGTSGQFNIYGVEVFSDPNNRQNGYVTWVANGAKTWTMKAGAVGANTRVGIGERLISEEPMSMIINFGMSNGFQTVDLAHLAFPNEMLVDYVRVYQRPGVGYLGCDPADRPTAAYIANHQDAYQNPNYTTWAAAGYTWPKNSLTGC